MKTTHTRSLTAAALICAVVTSIASAQKASDPLPSWNDGKAKQSIIDFVAKVTTPGSPDFVPVAERVATFDNDGTLWCEQPAPVHGGNRHLGRVRNHARGSHQQPGLDRIRFDRLFRRPPASISIHTSPPASPPGNTSTKC